MKNLAVSETSVEASACEAPAASKRQRTGSKLSNFLLNSALLLMACLAVANCIFPVFGNQLHAPNSRYNFGQVPAGTKVQHRFSVRNIHPWAVTVTGVSSDCGCTKSFAGRTPPFQLSPLQSVDVIAEVNTAGRKGSLSQSLTVATADNPQSTLLSMSGEVR